MTLLSNWLIKFWTEPPVTLLDWGWELTEEPQITPRINVNVVPIRYGAPFFELGDNAVAEIPISQINYYPSDEIARAEVINLTCGFPPGMGKRVLTIEIKGKTDKYAYFSESVISALRARRLADQGADGMAAVGLSYTILAKGLTWKNVGT